MDAISLVSPRKILIGGGSLAKLPALLSEFGLSRPLVVTDPWIVSSGMIDRVLAPLAKANMASHDFSDTVADPTDMVVKAGVEVLKSGHFDCLVGFGGGSPMDTAKAMAILAAFSSPAARASIMRRCPSTEA